MKTLYFIIAVFFIIPLFSFTSFKTVTPFVVSQETITVEGTYDGHEDYGYNFISIHDNGDEYTLTFQKVEEAVSNEFDLNSDLFIGTKFKVTYKTDTIVTKDSDGYEDENIIHTLLKLEKL